MKRADSTDNRFIGSVKRTLIGVRRGTLVVPSAGKEETIDGGVVSGGPPEGGAILAQDIKMQNEKMQNAQ